MIDPETARDLVSRLNAQHDALKSWRKVAALYPPVVKPGTLCRIAKGEYLPDDRKILRALGLLEPDEATKCGQQYKRAVTRFLKWQRG